MGYCMDTQSPWNEPDPPTTVLPPAYERPARRRPKKLPTFCMTIAIIDLVMASIRLLITPLSIYGSTIVPPDDPVAKTVTFEIGFNLFIGVAGIAMGIGMLTKKAWAIPVGWANVAITVLGIVFGIWQASIMMDTDPMITSDPAVEAGAMFGASCAVIIRLALVVLVAVALVKYQAWLDKRW